MTDEQRFRGVEQRLWQSIGVVPTEQRLHLERTGVDVRLQHVGEGPLVVFVHGASNAGTSWVTLVQRMDGFHCVLLDRPGCGLSQPLDRGVHSLEQLEAYADALLADLLDSLDVERAHVVATSYGGFFLLRGAAAHPERFDRIVELGWTMGAPMGKVPPVMRAATVPGLGRITARIPPTKAMVRMTLRQVGLRRALQTGRFTPEMVDWFQSLLRDTPTMRNELRASPRTITPLRGVNERELLAPELLARIAAPLLFLWGDEDPNGGESIAAQFVAHIPDATLEMVHQAGHAPWIDEPDRVAASVRSFLGAPS